jgi:hypothetical protein
MIMRGESKSSEATGKRFGSATWTPFFDVTIADGSTKEKHEKTAIAVPVTANETSILTGNRAPTMLIRV